MKKLVLNEEDIKTLENHLGNLPTFARTVNETMSVSQGINSLMQFLSSKMVEDEADGKLQS